MKLKVAFGTVVYPNTAPYLKDFFLSLRQQTYDRFDILCINDGLDSEHVSLLQRGLSQEILVIDGGKEGRYNIAGNRILLLNKAKELKYDLLVIGDSDDTFSKDRVEQMVKNYHEDYSFYYNQLCLKHGCPFFPSLPVVTDNIHQILEKNYLGMSNTAINMNHLDFQFIQSLSEGKTNIFDWYLFSRILLEIGKGKFVNNCFTEYRIYEQNIAGIMKMDKVHFEKELLVKLEHYELLKNRNTAFPVLLNKYKKYKLTDIEQIKKEPPFYWWGMIQLEESEESDVFIPSDEPIQ